MKNLSRLNTKFTDNELAEKSRTWLLLFKQEMADFEALDPDMNLAFAQHWLQVIESYERHQNDENTLDMLQQYTIDFDEAMDKVVAEVRRLEYFFDQLFEDTPYRKKEFGFAQIYRERYSRPDYMLTKCDALVEEASDLQTELSAAGMPPSMLPQLQAAILNARQRRVVQERYKTTRQRLTWQRILLVNNLYLIHRNVARAAQVVYYNNPIKARLFE